MVTDHCRRRIAAFTELLLKVSGKDTTEDNPEDTLLFAVENLPPLTTGLPWDSTSQIAIALDFQQVFSNEALRISQTH